MIDTIRVEGEYHARTGGMPTDNPYGKASAYREAWDRGFMDGMLYVRNELKVTQKVFYKAVDAKLALEAELKQVKAEYDAFLLEQGY